MFTFAARMLTYLCEPFLSKTFDEPFVFVQYKTLSKGLQAYK